MPELRGNTESRGCPRNCKRLDPWVCFVEHTSHCAWRGKARDIGRRTTRRPVVSQETCLATHLQPGGVLRWCLLALVAT